MMKFFTKSENETLKLAENIGRLIFPGAILLLSGNLGAGKTVFVKGLAKGMNCKDLVKSPSYTIMNIYDGILPLIHFDLYRFDCADDFYEIGGEEYLGGENVCAIEWHQKAKEALGANYLEIIINDLGEDLREMFFKPSGQKHESWLNGVKDDINR